MIRALLLTISAAPLLAVGGAAAPVPDLRDRLEALLAWEIEDDSSPAEVARQLALDAYFDADKEAAEEVLARLLDASVERTELHEADSTVAAMSYWFHGGAYGDPEIVRPLRLRALADTEVRDHYPLLAHEISACIDDVSWEAGLGWIEQAREHLDEVGAAVRLERQTYLDCAEGMFLIRLARFQDAAVSVESAQESLRELLVALEADPRAAEGFVYPVDGIWEIVQLTRLALPLAQTRFERVAAVYEDIAREPGFSTKSARAQARLELRLAMAEVEGRRRGLFPDADPVARLDSLVEELEAEPVDTFRCFWWAARALADGGDPEAAADYLAGAWDTLERFPAIARYELLAVALESRLARDRGEGAMREVLPRLEDAYARFLAECRATPLDETGTGFLAFEEWNLVSSELITVRDALEPDGSGAERALGDVIAVQALGSLARRLGAGEVDLDRIRTDLLAPGEGALVYAFGRERLHLFLVDRDEVVHVPLGSDFELDAAREEFLEVIRDAVRGEASVDDVDEPAAAFARVVLPAAARERLARWDGVVVVGLDAMGFAPFELLRPGGEVLGDARLGEARALRYLPSFPVAAELVARAAAHPPATRELSLFAAPRCGVTAAEAGRYLFGSDAVAALTAPFASSRSWVGPEEATVGALRGGDVGAAVVTHFVVHGERDLYRPRPGGLRLYRDGGPAPVWAEELEQLPASGVVVLTSCEAGRAPMRRGDDGVGHLGAAFFLGGSSTVLLSHTDIGLPPSIAALARFHANLRAGAGAAEAMRAARAALTDPVERFHAALVHVTGLAGSRFDAETAPAREVPVRGRRWILWGAGLAVAVAAAAALLRQRPATA